MNASTELLQEGLAKYVEFKSVDFVPTLGGVNNIVKRARVDDTDDYILRVYNNGEDTAKVEFEHMVLAELHKQSLSFELPTALQSTEGSTTFALLSNGSHASVFKVIPGVLPKLSAVGEIGKACGELTAALAKVHLELTPPTPPYFELYRVHHAINRELFFSELKSSAFDGHRASADMAGAEIERLEHLITGLLALQLPQQLIHGDLHYDNVLALDGKVTGVLDFEFCAMDWRSMDLAITLSKYASEANPLRYFQQIIHGYEQFVQLTRTEVNAMVDLVVLRILSNVVYFVGRAVAGEDSLSTLTDRIDAYMRRIEWLRAHRDDIVGCFGHVIEG
jgi:homoserine kinase type II